MRAKTFRQMARQTLLTLGAIAAAFLLVVLLPVLLPIAAAGAAFEERRLARAPCPNCGHAFGRAEVARAKREAGDGVRALLSRGLRPRVVTVWRLVCPNCGFAYGYRCGDPPGALAPLDPAPPD